MNGAGGRYLLDANQVASSSGRSGKKGMVVNPRGASGRTCNAAIVSNTDRLSLVRLPNTVNPVGANGSSNPGLFGY